MVDLFQGLLRGTAGALGELKEGGVLMQKNLDVAEGKRLDRLAIKTAAKDLRKFTKEEREAGQAFLAGEKELDRKQQLLLKKRELFDAKDIFAYKHGLTTADKTAMFELEAAHQLAMQANTLTSSGDLQKARIAHDKATRILNQSFTIINQGNEHRRAIAIQNLQGVLGQERINAEWENWKAQQPIILQNQKTLQSFVLTAQEKVAISAENRATAQSVLKAARDFQYDAKRIRETYGYTLKELEKRVEIAIATEKRANTEYKERLDLQVSAEQKNLKYASDIGDVLKEKWHKITTDAATAAAAKAFVQTVYDDAQASFLELQKALVKLDPEDDKEANPTSMMGM